MTVIAYRDGVIACDGCWSSDYIVITSQTKISKLASGALYGAAGGSDERELIELLQHVTTAEHLPSHKVLSEIKEDLSALLILPSREIWYIYAGPKTSGAHICTHEFAAVGAGDVVAFTAMTMNASAEKACEIACDLNINCRRPIYTLTLDS